MRENENSRPHSFGFSQTAVISAEMWNTGKVKSMTRKKFRQSCNDGSFFSFVKSKEHDKEKVHLVL